VSNACNFQSTCCWDPAGDVAADFLPLATGEPRAPRPSCHGTPPTAEDTDTDGRSDLLTGKDGRRDGWVAADRWREGEKTSRTVCENIAWWSGLTSTLMQIIFLTICIILFTFVFSNEILTQRYVMIESWRFEM